MCCRFLSLSKVLAQWLLKDEISFSGLLPKDFADVLRIVRLVLRYIWHLKLDATIGSVIEKMDTLRDRFNEREASGRLSADWYRPHSYVNGITGEDEDFIFSIFTRVTRIYNLIM